MHHLSFSLASPHLLGSVLDSLLVSRIPDLGPRPQRPVVAARVHGRGDGLVPVTARRCLEWHEGHVPYTHKAQPEAIEAVV